MKSLLCLFFDKIEQAIISYLKKYCRCPLVRYEGTLQIL